MRDQSWNEMLNENIVTEKKNKLKIGTIVINPYVREMFNDIPNPNYRTIYLGKSGRNSKCLSYTGEVCYFCDDVSNWNTDGYVDLKSELKRWFGIGMSCSEKPNSSEGDK